MNNVEYLNLKDAQIAYDFLPSINQTQKLLILVNGFQRTRSDFRAFRKRLSQLAPHVATLALDNRYCGQTKVTDHSELSVEQMAKDVEELATMFMQKLNLTKFNLLGISMGGMIAQKLAVHLNQQNKNTLDNLFLVSTTAGGSKRVWPTSTHEAQTVKVHGLEYENNNITLENTRKNMVNYFGSKFLKNSPLLFDIFCKNILKASQEEKDNINAKKQFGVSFGFDITKEISHVKANQVVIFSGDEDNVVPVLNAQFMHKKISNSILKIYPQVGHLLLIEEPEQFTFDLADFLK